MLMMCTNSYKSTKRCWNFDFTVFAFGNCKHVLTNRSNLSRV